MIVRDRGKAITPESNVTNEDVIASRLIPDLDTMRLQFIGKNWFKDNATGIAYHFVRSDADEISVKETRQSVAKAPKPKRIWTTDKPKFTTIKCVDCGAERVIHVQDAFQVKRCVPCQAKYRVVQRKARLKARKVEVAGDLSKHEPA